MSQSSNKYVAVEVYTHLLDEDDRIVFIGIRSDQKDYASQKAALPGGHIEEGETEKEAALRELSEETELDPDEDKLEEVGYLKRSWVEAYGFRYELNSEEVGDMCPGNKEFEEIVPASMKETSKLCMSYDDKDNLGLESLTSIYFEEIGKRMNEGIGLYGLDEKSKARTP